MSAASSATQSHSAQTTAARAQAANPRKPGASAHGPEAGTDLFAAMLSLLSATTDIPPDTSLTTEAATDEAANPLLTAADATTDPLAGLLGWPGAPLPTTVPGAGPLSSSASAPSAALNGAPLNPSGTTPAVPGALGTPQTGVDLQGMQRLEQPAAPDEQTLAALARSEGEPRTPPPPTVPGEAASTTRPTAWRSTVTSATTSSVQQQHTTQSLSQSLSERLQVRVETGNPVGLRSTVTLDERFNPASTGDSPALSAGLVAHSQGSAAGSGGFAGEQPGGGGDAGHEQPNALSTDTESPDESTRFDEALTHEDADEALGAWSSPTLRQASLRVGDGGEEAIDIQLSMTGQELNVDFRTDSAEARAELRENAGESLADLLHRSGIQLGGVSVGAQGQQHRGDPGEPRPHPGSGARNGGSAPAAAPAPAAVVQRPRSDGSRPLDLFV